MKIPRRIWLDVKKPIHQAEFILKSQGLIASWTEQYRQDLCHDAAVALVHRNLKSCTLSLLACDRTVLTEFRFDFTNPNINNGPPVHDHANGVELPVLANAKLVQSYEFTFASIFHNSYGHLLRLSWNRAKNLTKRTGASYSSNHAKKTTAGRVTGTFHVADEARHCLQVHYVCPRGTSALAVVAQGTSIAGAQVKLHQEHATPGFRFSVNTWLSAVVIQAPAGFFARAIRPL